jgi:putative (di)nucleoside polyphosphate hydrolase
MSTNDRPSPGYRRGVGIMLLDPGNRVWVGRRIDSPAAWQMPQGGIDGGETPREAAFRELGEETGTQNAEVVGETKTWLRYDLPPGLQGRKIWGKTYLGQEQKWFAMRFKGSDGEIDLESHHPEFDAWRWVPASELSGLIVPFKRALYEAIVAEFAALLASP